MGGIFTGVELDGSRLTQFVQNVGNGLVSAFEGFSVSPISITIFIALVTLFLADRLLRRRPKIQTHLI